MDSKETDMQQLLQAIHSLQQSQNTLASSFAMFQENTQASLVALSALVGTALPSPTTINPSPSSSPVRHSLDMSFRVYNSGVAEGSVESDTDSVPTTGHDHSKRPHRKSHISLQPPPSSLTGVAGSAGSTGSINSNSNATTKSIYNHRIVLTTYPGQVGINPISLVWGAANPLMRGPVVASRHHHSLPLRNAIGAHGGAYSVYRALAVAIGELEPNYKPNLINTEPVVNIGPFPSWSDPSRIVSMDPWGHIVQDVFKTQIAAGVDVRPTIAVTKAHMQLAEIEALVTSGSIPIDGKVVLDARGQLMVVKAAVEPVWFLPGIAVRFGCDETTLRRCLFEDTGGMYPELITRPDLKVFLPPIGGLSIYIFGNPQFISDPTKHLTLRVHDECNGSDVFGSDICTCRPYLLYGIEEAVRAAQTGTGVGVIVYFRKEGRALGEVTKYLVYNARKRAEGGDTAANYFQRTEDIAGVKDMRFQATMPDVLHWLGIQKIDRMISMSNMKYDAIVGSGIPILERVEIPPGMLPPDSQVEIDAKIAAGYFSSSKVATAMDLSHVKGRTWDDISH
ncbi:hypothetical protein BASA50_010972 [Batrachochytrium salamandrivorans]|uniref:GTP cyclohydrolase II n=1 Tax=Batrachochytrium salamandrivorans TaxID=1357716 RepID=A0ABQ8EWZ9_9FUNG|nr:hypothetical protein BASA60_010374 [Batrachochytrium salamandrivorans]KAH6587953.1 hypothetical protein BASA50_010972 [Batrachochytrium salamandrivorans]KAH9244557.1 hypothetical protein BASA81_018024 [Batrachochytrium salamandrivorans]KAJ1334292.1 hypothetical protein BSLG_008127 [Batrachochytrium salamandrivorans]